VGTTVAYAGGAVTALGALGVGLLFGQALIAKLTIPGAEAPPPRCSGDYGTEFGPSPVLRLAVIGDSTAAGYGVHTRAETPGALLATWIAAATRRPVRLTCPAFVGSVSAWLAPQVETAVDAGVDLAIIFIGANDVTTRAGDLAAVRHLFEAVRALRAVGAEVVVATCPDLGTIQPIQPPLRWLARRWSRQLAAAQTIATVRAGGRTVSLGDLLGPRFAAAPDRMFGDDRYHPSAEGYRAAAEVVLPSALAALGISDDMRQPVLRTRPEVLPLAQAAAAAAQRPGTEVSTDPDAGPDGGRHSTLAGLRRWVGGLGATLERAAAAHRRGLPVPSVVAGGSTSAVAPAE
jgi:lysophospholipase L1-like esterase